MAVTESPAPVHVDLGRERSYALHFEPLSNVPHLLEEVDLHPGRCLVVTDEQVAPLYLEPLREALRDEGWTPKSLIVPAGEATKSAEHLSDIYDEALTWGIDRSTPLLALGGGVVGDLGGFAAATLLRGIPLVQLPTTLIAQVDSALGGKTGVNHAAGKNLVGAFHQPAFVCADLETPHTLPEREWCSGLAEVVKHALIADPEFVSFLERHWPAVLNRDQGVVGPLIRRAAAIKARVVAEDEQERDLRAILNFGHTFGHAIERTAGYGTFTHGEAVAVGMRAALHLSHHLHPDLPLERADKLVRQLPVQGDTSALDMDELLEAMKYDKKVKNGTIRYVVLRTIGDAYLTGNVDLSAVEAAWRFATAR